MAGRVGRSLQLSQQGKQKAQKALTDRCLTQKELAKELDFSRETVSKFFRGLPVDRQYFVKICEELRLEWDEVTDKPTSQGVQEEKQQDSALDIDALVREVREKRHEKIQDQCGTMRMLGISQLVILSDIYTDVNILEQITSQQRREISDLARDFNPEADDFDRLGLGRVIQSRVRGLDAVKHYSKLMVLGKPGAGKTTFLQWIAMKCDFGEFLPNRVPIFISLKNFAEDIRTDNSKSSLWNYISEEFVISCKSSHQSVTETILTEGKALILLDGLDEVSEEDSDKVVSQIRIFTEKYFRNQFIITCRIAAHKQRFQGFTDVEMADFNSEQVKAFAEKWFVAVAKSNWKKGKVTAKQFIEKLNKRENQQIKELSVTPILLNLTCLVFLTKREFQSKRSELYEEGLEILLRQWDEERGIKRDEVYRNLSLEVKIELLTHVAAITFEKRRYFFEQDEIERYIADYLRTLPYAQTNQIALQKDSKAVLKAIEAQHGLLIERARKIYSFSHLTFQEYFTARGVINCFELGNLEKYVSCMSQKSWREVFLLAVGIIQNADKLLLSLKQKIDAILASNTKLQKFIAWSNHHCLNIVKNETFSAIYRAFFIAINLDQSRAKSLDLDRANMIDNVEIQRMQLGRESEKIYFSSMISNLNYYFKLAFERSTDFELAFTISQKTGIPRMAEIVYDEINQISNLKSLLKELELKNMNAEEQNEWAEKLNKSAKIINEFTKDWSFSYQESQLLKQYQNSNQLLVECLNSGCDVSPKVRQEIEDTLLLPIVEIEKYQQRIL